MENKLNHKREDKAVGNQQNLIQLHVSNNEGEVTILALGPLTNLALALHLNPDLLLQAKRVIILGGSIRGTGNVSPGVEFNFNMDPYAAKIVLERASSSNTTVTLVPMETCEENDLTQVWRWNSLAKINNSAVSFLNQLEEKEFKVHPSTHYYPYDTYVAAVALCTDFVIYSREFFGFVETESQKLSGYLSLDYNNITNNVGNVEVVMEVNATAIKAKLIENLSNFS